MTATIPDVRNAEASAAVDELSTYKWGFSTDIEQDFAPKGLNEDTVRFISGKKNEPEWMLEWRLKAYRLWLTMEQPDWAKLKIPPIDYQDAYYYAAPKAKPTLASLDELDPEIRRTYEKLGIYVPGAYLKPTDDKVDLSEAESSKTFECELVPGGAAGAFTCADAPIVMPVNAAGYTAQPAPTGLQSALNFAVGLR